MLSTTYSKAQPMPKHNLWFSGGLGKSELPSGMVAFGYEPLSKPSLLLARYVINTQLLSNDQPNIKVNEIGLLYGVKVSKFYFSSGISGVWGVNRGNYLRSDPDPLTYGFHYYEPFKYVTVGLPGEIRFITSTKNVGIGVTGFGNLNSKRSFVGVNLSLYLGRLK